MREFQADIKYVIITFIPHGGQDISWYDTLEEAIEDYDPLNWHQKLLKVVEIIP